MLRFVVFLAFFAAVVYAFFWLVERRNQGGGGGRGVRPTKPRGPVGPDDDEEFLRELDWKQRHPRRRDDDLP
jgi:hypothetical protein